ncbi:MAG: IS110 family transposase, partial [Candidatus Jordarchaeaceae archaeon]
HDHTRSRLLHYTALLILTEIGDIQRFPGPEKLVSWIGLAPRVHQSGEKLRSGAITKEGTPRLRWAFIQAARVAVRWDCHLSEKYLRIMRRRGDGKAIVAVAKGDRRRHVPHAHPQGALQVQREGLLRQKA